MNGERKFDVGDMIFNTALGGNVKIVAIIWDHRANNFDGGWLYQAPGFSTPDPYAAQEGVPTIEYRQLSENTYERI